MQDIIDSVKKNNVQVYSVSEVLNGKCDTVRLLDCELSGETQCVRNIYSSSKAYTMSAIGFLWDEGKVKLDDSLGKIFGKLPEGSAPGWEDVTVANLLQHKTGCTRGHDLDNENIRNLTDGDWLHYFWQAPITEKRGEVRAYSDVNFFMLSCIVTKITGRPMQDYLRDKLFNPCKYRDWCWCADPQGRALGGTGLYLASFDYIKLMQLWLQDGIWEGQRLISKEWITLTEENDYGLDCRSKEQGIYFKSGMLGQMMMYSRRDNRVIAIQSYSRNLGPVIDEVFPI